MLTLAHSGKLSLITSALTIANAAYVLRRKPPATTRAQLRALTVVVKAAGRSARQIQSGISAASAFSDIEDAFQHAAAQIANWEVIIARDVGDFAAATLPVITPIQYLASRTT